MNKLEIKSLPNGFFSGKNYLSDLEMVPLQRKMIRIEHVDVNKEMEDMIRDGMKEL